jgi:hypothetical protein
MDQDIAVKLMMLEIKVEENIPEEYSGYLRKYLHLMWVVGFEEGRNDVYAIFGAHKKAVIQRDSDGTRIAQYESIIDASRRTGIQDRVIFRALKTHKKTREGHYWERVS